MNVSRNALLQPVSIYSGGLIVSAEACHAAGALGGYCSDLLVEPEKTWGKHFELSEPNPFKGRAHDELCNARPNKLWRLSPTKYLAIPLMGRFGRLQREDHNEKLC